MKRPSNTVPALPEPQRGAGCRASERYHLRSLANVMRITSIAYAPDRTIRG